MTILRVATLTFIALSSVCAQDTATALNTYTTKILVTNIPGVGVSSDRFLVNPWGLSRLANPFLTENQWWAADNATGVASLYDANGTSLNGFTVKIPSANGTSPGSPTGTVGFNQNFYFATADGTLSIWKSTTTHASPNFAHHTATIAGCAVCHTTAATLTVNNSSKGASYNGLTVASSAAVNAGEAILYVANSAGGVETYDAATFAPVALPAGAFVDANLPAGYTPAGIQSLGADIVITFAPPFPAPAGAADVFSPSGTLLMRLQSGSWFSQPFGIAQAPSKFGPFSNDILIGNTLSGTILAFDPTSGNYLGMLTSATGAPIAAPGLWGISFGNGSAESGPANVLYFNAGIGNYKLGLFGAISPSN